MAIAAKNCYSNSKNFSGNLENNYNNLKDVRNKFKNQFRDPKELVRRMVISSQAKLEKEEKRKENVVSFFFNTSILASITTSIISGIVLFAPGIKGKVNFLIAGFVSSIIACVSLGSFVISCVKLEKTKAELKQIEEYNRGQKEDNELEEGNNEEKTSFETPLGTSVQPTEPESQLAGVSELDGNSHEQETTQQQI